jgi:undecaprenyl pyrophosphate synthase
MDLNVAVAYGGREEIAEAVRVCLRDMASKPDLGPPQMRYDPPHR